MSWLIALLMTISAPRVFFLDARHLEATRQRGLNGDQEMVPALEQLERDARKAMTAGPFTITSKDATPPSGDKHDYMTQAPYWWPDPAKPTGLPYIRRDGERNPELDKLPDHQTLDKMIAAVETLSIAYYFKGDEAYASKAAQFLRVFFLDPSTRMNPNLQFSQGIPGVNTGRGIGLIETRGLTRVVDAIGLLGNSGALTDRDRRGLQEWFGSFLQWMLDHPYGRDEAAAKNNHGTYYDVQVASFALFVGRNDVAKKVLETARQKRIATQIEPDGRQPLELDRTKGWGYSVMNLEGLTSLALLGQNVAVDLWTYRTPDGRSIQRALEYLLPFALREKPWPLNELGGLNFQGFFPLARRAGVKVAALTSKIPAPAASERSVLLLPQNAEAAREKRLQWWREARFGMFIHWGLYAVPAGEWKGKLIPGIGEWIMNRAKIPVSQYEQLAKQFDPEKFNAEEWVNVAKNAGMKYIVITSKHHDGFAMYGSKASRYNIVDATPFKRDPLKELAAAAEKAGIKFGFYYSQTQDWHEPDAVGNDWDFPDEGKKNFARYLEDKVKPQVRELLTNYGPIGLIWFDTPRNMTREQSQELADLVHQIQPDCIVSGRVGNGVGDYDSVGDNQISVGSVRRDWETPVTLNDTWGFKKDDRNWKSTAILIRQLVSVASRGGNYLLNVGPTSEGLIPRPSVDRLADVGRWLKTNSASVYGTSPSPFPYELPWGIITTKPGKLYLHVFEWPRKELVLVGLKSKVQKAYLLANNVALKTSESAEALRIALPEAPDKNDSVIVLEIQGQPTVDTSLLQQFDNSITLPAYLAEIHKAPNGPSLGLDSRGVIEKWLNKEEWLDWNFKMTKPGKFEVVIVTSEQKYGAAWEGEHQVSIELAGQKLSNTVSNHGKEANPANPYWPYVVSRMGTVKIDKPGTYSLALKPELLRTDRKLGLTLVSVKLVPVK